MIAIVLGLLILALLARTPWRRLPMAVRVWAALASINTLVFFGTPTTPATSPWRPVVGRVLAGSAVASLALLVVGLILLQRYGAVNTRGSGWAGPLIIAALPIVSYAFFRIIGPLY
jgi:hypothetical protein